MLIKDLKPKEGNIEVEAKIIEIGDVREFSKEGKEGKVAKSTIEDGSGRCTLTLWNEQIDELRIGDLIKLTNGWCDEWKGEIQLSAGKFGKIEKVTEPKLDEPQEIPEKEEVSKQIKFFEEELESDSDDVLTRDGEGDII